MTQGDSLVHSVVHSIVYSKVNHNWKSILYRLIDWKMILGFCDWPNNGQTLTVVKLLSRLKRCGKFPHNFLKAFLTNNAKIKCIVSIKYNLVLLLTLKSNYLKEDIFKWCTWSVMKAFKNENQTWQYGIFHIWVDFLLFKAYFRLIDF